MYQDEDRADAMREAGASAYVTKTAGRDALMDALRSGSNGAAD
jgi:DNA-binding NarL/FixJ family response regulator